MTDTYAFLIRESDWDSDRFLPGAQPPASEADQAVMAQHGAFQEAVAAMGARLVGGSALQDAKYGGVVTPGPAGREVEDAVYTDSPYADSSELITGFYLAEVASEDVARRIAAMVPTNNLVEWRKVLPQG